MDEHQQILQEIESQWPGHIRRGLAELTRLHPDEEFYAAAFWLFYCDYTIIGSPTFGANSESVLKDEVPGEWSNRWQPYEWRWDVLETVCDGMQPFYRRLSESMDGASKSVWDAVFAANEELIGRVARSVTQAIRGRSGEFRNLALPENFLIFAVDVREDAATNNRLLRLSVDEANLPMLKELIAPEE